MCYCCSQVSKLLRFVGGYCNDTSHLSVTLVGPLSHAIRLGEGLRDDPDNVCVEEYSTRIRQ